MKFSKFLDSGFSRFAFLMGLIEFGIHIYSYDAEYVCKIDKFD